MSPHQLEFSARLARIESGVGSSKSTLYVGMDETYAVSYRRPGQTRGNSVADVMRNAGYPIMVAIAFLVGVMGNAVARLLDFWSNGLPNGSENIDFQLVMDTVIACMVASLLGLIFRIGIREFIMVRLMGIVAGTLGLHNLVHAYPSYFEPVFSTLWVSYITRTTEAGSIVWRGVSIAM